MSVSFDLQMASDFYTEIKSLSKSSLVSEFKKYSDLTLTKRCVSHFKDKSMLSGNITHCKCPNMEKTVQTENG